MVRPLFKLIVLISMLSSLISCAVSPSEMELLDRSASSYERAIRWGEFARAKSFHKKSATLSDLERRRLKGYRVTDFSVIQNNTSDMHNSQMIVEIKYYKNDRPVIKTLTVKQSWKRDKDSSIWYLDSLFPKFK